MPKPYPDKAVSQIRIDKQLFEKIKAIAEQQNRSMNSQIEFFLRQAVSQYGQRQHTDVQPQDR